MQLIFKYFHNFQLILHGVNGVPLVTALEHAVEAMVLLPEDEAVFHLPMEEKNALLILTLTQKNAQTTKLVEVRFFSAKY